MKTLFTALILVVFVLSTKGQELKQQVSKAPARNIKTFKKVKLLYKDDFTSMKNWIAEFASSPASKVSVEKGKLLIDVNGGATVWFKNKLSGNIMITYNRKVIVDSGKNDRLSDFNQFWMSTDPKNKNLFTRKGVFSEYDSLLLYYVGFGGNSNKTTRFRKYDGKGNRVLYYDLTDKAHLLAPNKNYHITTVVYNGVTRFFVDDEEVFSFDDPDPLGEGYFGFRTTQSRQYIDGFRVYQLK